MSNYQYIKVPFIAGFPNGPYFDQAGLSIILSGDYFLATAAPEDFEEYATGFRSFFSGTGNWGPGTTGYTGPGSGYAFIFTKYFFDTFENYGNTGIFQSGSFLNSGLLQSGYIAPFSLNITGTTYGIDNIVFESFTGYITGNNTGFFPGLFTNNYISLLQRNVGSQSGFANYNVFAVFEGFTGYNTGFFYNPFGHVSLNNPVLNSGLSISGYNISNPCSGITFSVYPISFINSGLFSGYWNNPTGNLTSSMAPGTINSSGVYVSGANQFYYPYNTGYLLNDFTVEFWVKRDKWVGPFTRIIGHNSAVGFAIDQASGTNLFWFEVMNDPSSHNSNVVSTHPLSNGVWTHIACVRQGINGYIYISGALDNSGLVTGAQLTSVDNIYLGIGEGDVGSTGSEIFTGVFDEVRIWNYARSSSEINANYNKTIDPYSSGLINYLRVITP